jgi:hypothetical protein
MWPAATPLSVQDQPHLGDAPLLFLNCPPDRRTLRARILGRLRRWGQRLVRLGVFLACPWEPTRRG